jgi:hypothetical protein
MNKIVRPSQKNALKIVEEIRNKKSSYEGRMSNRLGRWTEISEYFHGKTYTEQKNAKISPNSAEMYKSIRAIVNMKYRMLTGSKPMFMLSPNDLIGDNSPERLIIAEHYVNQQLELGNFNNGLYLALYLQELYGTAVVHSQYEPKEDSFLGQKQYFTSYRPVSLINCAFALDSYDATQTGWVAITDIQGRNSTLNHLLNVDTDGKVYDTGAIKEILNGAEYDPQINQWVRLRMAWSGFLDGNFHGGMERTFYYGLLDALDDGQKYLVEMVNNEHIIRMEAYDGIRPVRVSTINNIDITPLGDGQGDMFRPALKQLDDVRNALLNTCTFAGANMFAKKKSYSEEDSEMAITNFGLVNMDNPNIVPLGPNPNTINALAAYEDRLTKNFRNAVGAQDVLQAVVNSDATTATEVSLAMNEAVRNISVSAEMVAPFLVKDHIRLVLQNAQKYVQKPFTMVVNGKPIVIRPSDLLIDTNVTIKTMTDQDFRPARVRNLMTTLQLINTIPPQAMQGVKINIVPTLVELLRLLDIPNYQESVQVLTANDLMRQQLMAQLQAQQATGPQSVGNNSENRLDREGLGRMEQRNLNKGVVTDANAQSDTIQTPAGQVLSAPGDQAETLNATRSASVGQNA